MSDLLIPPNRRILIIDDNPSIHADFQKIFRVICSGDAELQAVEAALFGDTTPAPAPPLFTLDSAFQGEEGLRKIIAAAAAGQPYAMVFTDMRMPPGWDGMETTLKLWEVCPDLQVVICTAYSDHSWQEMLEKFGQTDRLLLLKKPFDNLEVLQLAHTLTEKWRLLQYANAKTGQLEACVAERTRALQTANDALQAEIAERARVEEVLRQAQKMEAVGQLAAGVAHDFNNLLSVIRSYSGMLLDDARLAADVHEALREVDSAAERATNLTRQLLTFSRRQVIQSEYLDLDRVVAQVSKLLHRVLGEAVSLEIETSGALPSILADRGMVEQVILNLAVNARDAMPDGGPLLIQTTAVLVGTKDAQRSPEMRPGQFVCLSITDSGCGISPEVMPRLFEPFFTTKEVGQGTGLGLATVYGIVQQHEGWIEVESKLGRGTTFKVYLPESVAPAEIPEAPAAPATATGGGGETILLVEDEAALRNVAQLVLQHYGYRVFTAASGLEALALWPACRAEVDLLLTDMIMPGGVSGRELAQRLQAGDANLQVIYTSGYCQELSEPNGVLEEGLNYLPKPYHPAKLAAIIRECLDRRRPAARAAGFFTSRKL